MVADVPFAGTQRSWLPPANAACWLSHSWSMSCRKASPRLSRSGRNGRTSFFPFGWRHTVEPLRITAGCGSPYPRTPFIVPK